MIYLDNAATTKPDPGVIDAMRPFLFTEYGNPGATYPFGRYAADAVKAARENVAALIGAEPSQIVFTSGGTESNNTVIHGIAKYMQIHHKKCIITDKSEHESILGPVKDVCAKYGFYARFLPVNEDGTVNYSELTDISGEDVGIVSVMFVNNETGAENDVAEIARICKEKGVLFHTDCVQAAGGYPIDVKRIGCDFLSMSAHKLHGIKGVGALYVRDKSVLTPLILGGARQEWGLRGGTENVPGIVAFGKAAEIAKSTMHENDIHISTLRQVFYTTLTEELEKCGLSDAVMINGQSIVHHGKILNIRVNGVDGETLLLLMGSFGICISAGSACKSRSQTPSSGLLSMGLSPEEARSSIRISFSKYNTEAETVQAAKKLASCIKSLQPC